MRMHLKNKLKYIILMILMSCNNNSLVSNYKENKLIYRDSVQIFYTLNQWKIENFWIWGARPDLYKIKDEDLVFLPYAVFYSPDSLKILIWVQDKMPNAQHIKKYSEDLKLNRICPNSGDTIYGFTGIIGIRENKNDLWDIYNFEEQKVICCSKPENGIPTMENYYFRRMKYDADFVDIRRLDSNFGGKVNYKDYKADTIKYKKDYLYLISKEYGYNLQDEGFWEKSLLWQKGVILDSLYLFQTQKHYPIEKPKVEYPEEILRLFNEK